MSRNTGHVTIEENSSVLNEPSLTNTNAGVLFNRFQEDNDAGTGAVVNGKVDATGTFSSATTFPVSFTTGGDASTVDDFYNGWWIRITNNTPAGILNEVRHITGYVGASRTVTLSAPFTAGAVTSSTQFSLFAGKYVSVLWNETNGRFECTNLPENDVNATNTTYACMQCESLSTNSVQSLDSNYINIESLPYNLNTNTVVAGFIPISGIVGGMLTLTNGANYTLPITTVLINVLGISSGTFTDPLARPTIRVLLRLPTPTDTAIIDINAQQQWINKPVSSSVTITGGAELVMIFESITSMLVLVLE